MGELQPFQCIRERRLVRDSYVQSCATLKYRSRSSLGIVDATESCFSFVDHREALLEGRRDQLRPWGRRFPAFRRRRKACSRGSDGGGACGGCRNQSKTRRFRGATNPDGATRILLAYI